MGLGMLFIGYVLVSIFTFAPTYFVTDLIGSFVMYEALIKLRPHAEKFKYAIYAVYALFAVSVIQCAYYTLSYVGIIPPINDSVFYENVLNICRLGVMFVYTASMLTALRELALSVGDEKLGDKCNRNIWLYCINYVFMIALSLDFDFMADFISAFFAFGLLYRLICEVLICANIYSCYMWICLESDHDMTPKEKSSKLGEFLQKVKNGGTDDVTREDLEKTKAEKRASESRSNTSKNKKK